MDRRKLMSRRAWTREETRTLLCLYKARQEEFSFPRKRISGYKNLVEDLTSSGVLKSPVTLLIVENKIKSIVRAYTEAEDNSNRSGSGPCVGPHAVLVEDIFSTRACRSVDIPHIAGVGVRQAVACSVRRKRVYSSISEDVTPQEEIGEISTQILSPPISSQTSRKMVSSKQDRILDLLETNEGKWQMRWEAKQEMKEGHHRENMEWRLETLQCFKNIQKE